MPRKKTATDEPTQADFELIAETQKALCDPNRIKLLRYVANKPGVCIVDMLPDMGGLAQPTLSHHMKLLGDVGLVSREKKGVYSHFTINKLAVEQLASPAIRELIGV